MKNIGLMILIAALITFGLCACSSKAPSSATGNAVLDTQDVAKQGSPQAPDAAPTAVATKPAPIEQNSNVQSIADIKKPENVGKTFTVQGVVVSTMQKGSISGYKIQDSTDFIDISSQKIPQKDTTVTVTGTLKQSRYFGLIIQTTE
jgi:hypothetical protein